MTEFQQNTELLRGQLEKGDIAKICNRAGCVPNTLYSALNKSEATELTKTEKTAYDAFVAFVNERIREKVQLSQRAANVAEKLTK